MSRSTLAQYSHTEISRRTLVILHNTLYTYIIILKRKLRLYNISPIDRLFRYMLSTPFKFYMYNNLVIVGIS